MSSLYTKEHFPGSKCKGCYGEFCAYYEDEKKCEMMRNGIDPKYPEKTINSMCSMYNKEKQQQAVTNHQ